MYVLPECYHEGFYIMSVYIIKKIQERNTAINNTEETWLKVREDELEWLSGFSEAESMFYISTTGAISFKIKLHWDDRQTLEYIKNLLSELVNREVGVIVDSKNQHESYYIISKFQDILEVLIPIFSKYYLTTSKFLDFQDFKAAAEIRKTSYMEKRRLTKEELNEILRIKSDMNSKRLEFNINDLPKRPLTIYRFLGFVEGDGSFYISNMVPTFSIKQHSKNVHFFYQIAEFLNKQLPYCPEIGPKIDKLNTRPTPGIYHDSPSTCNLSVANILQNYNYILPFFKSLKFRSRKGVDFELWELAVKLKTLGYTTKPEGKKCFIEITKYINKRYTTDAQVSEAPNLNKIHEILNQPPVFDLSSGISYKALSDIVKVSKKGNSGFGVNVYDNGRLLEGSPFRSYTQAALALGNVNVSSVISKKIDTDKLYKGRYKFGSSV